MASYASKINERYEKRDSHYVDVKQRIDNTINIYPPAQRNLVRGMLKKACETWKKNNPHIKKWQDLNLCQSLMVPLSSNFIDITMQRLLDLGWACTILEKFRDVQIMPIQVYVIKDDPDAPAYLRTGDLYAGWDGQHTVVVLYLIAVWIFGLDPRKVEIPVNVYRVKSKADIRANLLGKNTEDGTKLFDSIDKFQQQVFGVKVDGSTNPRWKDAALKQDYLAAADLFVTHEKFADTDKPGAISRMKEIDAFGSLVIKDFAIYASAVQYLTGARPIDSQEIEIMSEWFNMARGKGIEYTEEEIQNLAQHLVDLFNADFHETSEFWIKARDAYQHWWEKTYQEVEEELRPKNSRMNKNWKYGGVFLWHQLRKTWKGRIPELTLSTDFYPNKKDLF